MATQVFTATSAAGIFGQRFEASIAQNSVAASDPTLVPAGVRGVNCTIAFSNTATAKVQYTNSSMAAVEAGTAVWIDAAAAISANGAVYVNPCTAIRLNTTAWTSGTVVLSAVAQ